MCLWFAVLMVSLFLLTFHKAQACEVPKFMTGLALVLFAGQVKPSKLRNLHICYISLSACMHLWIKGLLVVACLFLICIFYLCGPWLCLGLLLFNMWHFSALMSHEVNLGSLHFPCNLLDMSHCGL